MSLSSPSPPLYHCPPCSHCLQAVKQTQKAWDELSGMEMGTPRLHPEQLGNLQAALNAEQGLWLDFGPALSIAACHYQRTDLSLTKGSLKYMSLR